MISTFNESFYKEVKKSDKYPDITVPKFNKRRQKNSNYIQNKTIFSVIVIANYCNNHLTKQGLSVSREVGYKFRKNVIFVL